ncbi:hypothetical protein MA9V2_159 [Chryseobacterium phage MA9V-2]|nr:hypothetical protein MA9V2_159 [Chryseobacterium phage MA9V-2]
MTEMNDELRNSIFSKDVNNIDDIIKRSLNILGDRTFLVYKGTTNSDNPQQFYVTLELTGSHLTIKFYHGKVTRLNDCAAYLNIKTVFDDGKKFTSYTTFNIGSVPYIQHFLSIAKIDDWMTLPEFEVSKFSLGDKMLHQYATTVQNMPDWKTLVAGKNPDMLESLYKMAIEWYFNGSPKDHNVNNH